MSAGKSSSGMMKQMHMAPLRKACRLGCAALFALGLGACSFLDGSDPSANSSTIAGSAPAARADLGTLTYRAVDLMLAETPGVATGTPMVVTTISDIDDLNTASPLGNMVSDLVRTRLVQSGASVSEMRMRGAVLFDRKQGEIMLTRQINRLIRPANAAVVVTGTYAAGFSKVYVSLKMVAVADGRILAGADYVLPRGADVEGLLRRKIAAN
jgi:FlgO protein